MSDADVPFSSPPPTSGDASGASNTSAGAVSISSMGHYRDNAPLTVFQQYQLERAEKEREAGQQQPEQAGGVALPPSLLGTKPMDPNGDHPQQPHADEMIKHFDELARGAEEQRQSVREKDQRESEGRNAEIRAQMALANSIAAAMERGAETKAILQENAAVEAGYRQLEGQTKSGAAQYDRTEVAGWREYHLTEQRGLGQLDHTETAGERQHETEERRRTSGMSL